MKKEFIYLKPEVKKGKNGDVLVAVDITDGAISDQVVREHMLQLALDNGQYIKVDTVTGRAFRTSKLPKEVKAKKEPVKAKGPVDPVVAFIKDAPKLKPSNFIIDDLKWKYLVRSVVRGKNIMMTGPAGSGKTMASKHIVTALDRPHFYFNLGATQDPRATLIGNTHFKKETGTLFADSVFVKAIQTKDAVILLDEISRAHPEAWNILMTVLDEQQRYLRLDEHEDAPTIKVADGVTFIATANIGNEYTATRTMDRALLDRFIIIEMAVLNGAETLGLLKQLHGNVAEKDLEIVTSIYEMLQVEQKTDNSRITSAISTRSVIEIASLLEDGFDVGEAAEVAIYPFFDPDGGVDSERTFVKQVVQKFLGETPEDEDLFNVDDEVE